MSKFYRWLLEGWLVLAVFALASVPFLVHHEARAAKRTPIVCDWGEYKTCWCTRGESFSFAPDSVCELAELYELQRQAEALERLRRGTR